MMAERTVCIYIVAVLIFTLLRIINGQNVPCNYPASKVIDGVCYRPNFNKLSWTEARDSCEKWNGKLATFTSIEQMVTVQLALGFERVFWMGAPNDVQDIGAQWLAVHGKAAGGFFVFPSSCQLSFHSLCIVDYKNSSLNDTTPTIATDIGSNNKTQTTLTVTCLNADSVSVDGQCYRLSTGVLYRTEANSYCNGRNEALATISSVEQGTKVLRALNYINELVWINYPIKNDKDHFAVLYDIDGCVSYSYGYYFGDFWSTKVLCTELH